jgi:KDO2-lipid IV(A) lauroyltransferase
MRFLVRQLCLALLHGLAILPQIVTRPMAKVSGWLMWRANGRLRRVTERNLDICFPDLTTEQRAKLARSSLLGLSSNIIDIGRTWIWRPERLLRHITRVSGEDHLRDAIANGKGTLVLLPHLGNWELMSPYFGARGSTTAMYGHAENVILDDIVHKARQRSGITMVHTGVSGVRALLKELKAGNFVLMLPDQVPQKGFGMFAPFFGEPAYTMTLATNLLQRTGAKAVCGFCKRLPDGNYEIVFRAVDDAIYDPDDATALDALNKSVETCVLDCPEQYQWGYKRFKLLPNMEKRDYLGEDDDSS